MHNFFLITFIVVDVLLIFVIVIQNGASGEISSSFNSSDKKLLIPFSRQNTLIRITSVLAGLFFLISLILSNINYHNNDKNKIFKQNYNNFSSIN